MSYNGKKMEKVAAVVLNYCNYQETENCVESLLRQKEIDLEIVIVDNGSSNDSYKILANRYAKFSFIHVLHAKKNYGFAKGNNIGIHYAGKLGARFVYLLNSDIILIGETCIASLIREYKKGIGVIGARIIERNGKEGNFFYDYPLSPEKWWYFGCLLFNVLEQPVLAEHYMKKLARGKKTEILQGSNLLLTPEYLKECGLLYSHTFLYCEEALLYLQCREHGLKLQKAETAQVFHKGSQSSGFLYKKDTKRTAQYRYILKSHIHVLFYPVLKYL